MGWATAYIEKLKKGATVQFRPRGNSMTGKVNDGQLVTVEPLREDQVAKPGDIVLCKVNGREYLHLVKAMTLVRVLESTFPSGVVENKKQKTRYLIGNNKGFTNGWTTSVYGRVTKVED